MISFNKIFKNNFVKNVLNVSFFTILAQVVGVISLPIITRIYSPSDFGLYSFFVTVMSISGLLATGKFDSAILVSDNKTKRKNLMKIILLISICASFCFLVLFFIIDLFNLETFQLENKYELLIDKLKRLLSAKGIIGFIRLRTNLKITLSKKENMPKVVKYLNMI